MLCFFFKQKTAYEMRISDCSSDVCSSDLVVAKGVVPAQAKVRVTGVDLESMGRAGCGQQRGRHGGEHGLGNHSGRSEEHTSAPVTNAHLVCRLLLEKKKNTRIQRL